MSSTVLPRMKVRITRNCMFDELLLVHEGKSYLTTGRPGSFTAAVVREHKRRFAGVPKVKKA